MRVTCGYILCIVYKFSHLVPSCSRMLMVVPCGTKKLIIFFGALYGLPIGSSSNPLMLTESMDRTVPTY